MQQNSFNPAPHDLASESSPMTRSFTICIRFCDFTLSYQEPYWVQWAIIMTSNIHRWVKNVLEVRE